MKIARGELLRLSTYILACVGAVSLYLAEEEGVIPYGWITVLAAILAYGLCDRRRLIEVPQWMDGLLATCVLGLLVYDAGVRGQPFAQALGHVLVLLQLFLFFHRKNLRTYLLMAGISLPQMAIGAIVNNEFYYGVLLAIYVVLSAVVLAQLHALFSVPPEARPGVLTEPVRLRLVGRLAVVGLLTGIVGLGGFLLIPRRGQPDWQSLEFTAGENLTGFDEEVTLGELGTILQNDNEVMSVRLTDENGNPYTPPDEPLWRGITLTHYEDGKWSSPLQTRTGRPLPRPQGPYPPGQKFIVQEITLQPIRTDFCFAFWPPRFGWAEGGGSVHYNSYGNALLQEERVEMSPFDYTVVSPVGSDTGQISFPLTRAERQPEIWNGLVGLNRSLREQLRQYIDDEIMPLEELESLPPEERCRVLNEHLQFRGGFTYTLDQQVVDPTLDPVVDFLRNRRAGHCEYFATALALMLRAVDVPSRIVNGFKGAEINEVVTRLYIVRQMHAHTWVEAAVPDPEVRPTGYRWIVLDPTPGAARREQVARIAAQRSAWKRFRDALRQLWSRYVLNFDFSEQQELIYGPLRELGLSVAQAFSRWRHGILQGDRRTLLSTVTGLAAAAMLVAGSMWWSRRKRHADSPTQRPPAVYRRLRRQFLRHARRLGVAKQPSDTILEVANEMSRVLAERAVNGRTAELPRLVAIHLYLLRYRPGTNGEVSRQTTILLRELGQEVGRVRQPR